MPATIGALKKVSAGASAATIRAEFKQFLIDSGLTVVDDYSTFLVISETFGGAFATPVFLNLYVPGSAAATPGSVEGVYLGWNATSHVGVNRLSSPGANFSNFMYPSSPTTGLWGSSYTGWLQHVSGPNYRMLTCHLSTSTGVVAPNVSTLQNWQPLRYWAADNPPNGWPAGTPYVLVEGMYNAATTSANQAAGYASFTGSAATLAAATMPHPVSGTYGNGVRGQMLVSVPTSGAVAGGAYPLFRGRACLAWDGKVYRGAIDYAVLGGGVNVYNALNFAAGDRVIVTAGAEEYAVIYATNLTNTTSTLVELLRTV